jgi:hypothetical protein
LNRASHGGQVSDGSLSNRRFHTIHGRIRYGKAVQASVVWLNLIHAASVNGNRLQMYPSFEGLKTRLPVFCRQLATRLETLLLRAPAQRSQEY